MANRERGEFTLTAGTDRYTLRLTTDACCQVEDYANKTWGQIMAGCRADRYNDVVLLLWAALREHHPTLASDDQGKRKETRKGIADLIDAVGGLTVLVAQLDAFFAMNDKPPELEEKAEGKDRPPDAQAGTGDSSTSTVLVEA